MKTINCSQLLNYYAPDEFAVMHTITKEGTNTLYLIDGTGTQVFSCPEDEFDYNQESELKLLINSFATLVVYDFNKLKEIPAINKLFSSYQPLICDVAADMAAVIGTYDYDNETWLIRDIKEILDFYRYESTYENSVDKALAILWIAEVVTNENTSELMIKREQKLIALKELKRRYINPMAERR